MKIKDVNIKKITNGDKVCGFFICKSFSVKFTRLGDEYIDCILENKTGNIRGKVWSFVEDFKKRISAHAPVAVKGSVINYNDNLEVNISSINIADSTIYETYGYNQDSLVKAADDDMKKLYTQLDKYLNTLNSDYKRIVKKIVKNNYKKFTSYPSIDKPYMLKGGLLKQIVTLLILNDKIHKQYKSINNDVVKAGIIIKNIGCLYYFNDDFQFSVSKTNKKIGCKLHGVNLINDYALSYSSFSHDIKTQLQNIILSENSENDVNINYINSIYAFDLNIK